VLGEVAKAGLPGNHHFFVTFLTGAPGVRISTRLHEKYPEQMTIVLQHQFWDLTVGEESFDVGLSFNGIPERLTIPFEAVKGFFDPSVNFGLQFAQAPAVAEPGAVQVPPSRADTTPGADKEKAQADAGRKTLPAPTEAEVPGGDTPDKPKGGGEVVRLDRFRKK
jgi:hypothetical protein